MKDTMKKKLKMKKLNEKGQLTLEFMVALILVVSVSTLLGVLTFALSLTEVLQYVTFSGARSYFAGDMDQTTQADAGNTKANQLLKSLPFLAGARQSQWITVKSPLQSADYTSYGQSINADPHHNQFVGGFQINVTMPFLSVQIPFIKDVLTPPSGQTDFATTISSFLTREPSFSECQAYLNAAWPSLVKTGSYTNSQISGAAPVVILDNGC